MVNVLTLWKFLMTWHYLMPWHTFWRHDELFNVMVCSLLQGEFVVVMMYFMTCLYCPDILFHHFANKILSFDVMTNFLTSWCVLYFKVNLLLSWRISWPAYIVLTFFCEQNIMKTYFWCRWHYDICFYFMLNVWHHDKPFVIMPCFWLTFWRHGKFVDVMICFWHHDDFFFDIFVDAMTCFWRHSKFVDAMTCFWLHDTLLWHISDVMTNLVTSRRVVDVIDVFWRVCDIMTNFLKYIALIDVMTNVLMSWKFWRHDTLFTSWRTTCFYIMTNLFVVMTYFCHYFGNTI